jgi:hypothetical protein
LWGIFEGLNDWNIVQLVPQHDNDEEEMKIIHRIVLDAKVRSLRVLDGEIGAFRTEDPDSDGYYLVKWSSAPWELQEAIELTKYDPPILVPKEELVVDAEYFSKVARAPCWYIPVPVSTNVHLQRVILEDLILYDESEASRLPNACKKKKPGTKDPKGYPSKITAVYWIKLPEWRFWNSLKLKMTSWIIQEARDRAVDV